MPTVELHCVNTVAFDAVRIEAKIRHADEDCPGLPFLDGELEFWRAVIDLEPVATIRGWPGPEYMLETKVCDECSVYLLNGDEVVAMREDNYVPSFMPGDHYGDYLILDIAADGVIRNWKKSPDYGPAFRQDDDD